MRIVHLGWGFEPWRPGGLIRYAEDVMALQVARGHEVHHVCSGRRYPLLRAPRVKRRVTRGVHVHELVNPPIVAGAERGTREPARDVREPWTERVLARILAGVRPDVLHVQELLGFPSSVLDVAREAGVPVVMTLQDYFPLCPSVRLVDGSGARCLDGVTPACARACELLPVGPGALVDRTLRFELTRAREAVPGLRNVTLARLAPLVDPLVALAGAARPGGAPGPGRPVTAAEIERRREATVQRLDRVDVLIAQSHRVEEIYRRLGVRNPRLRTLHLTLAHIEHLHPRPPRPPGPLTLATIDGLSGPAKGSELLLEAVELVRRRVGPGRFRLLAFGFSDPAAAARAAGLEEVELRGLFAPEELDGLLDEADVGVIASTWEEAYGYVGLEFLAKGVPLLANAVGGVVDYAREGETAWLNRPATAAGMADRIVELIERPQAVGELAARVRAARGAIVKPFARHGDELEAIYREAATSRAS